MDNQTRTWQLLSKRLAGEATPEEKAELELLLSQHPGHGIPVEMLIDLWKMKDKQSGEGVDEAFQRVAYRLSKEDINFGKSPQPATGKPVTVYRKKQKKKFRLFPSNGMLIGYFKTTYRNLLRSKTFSIINIAGLSLGIACAMLLLLWVRHVVSFDRFHEKVDRIYQVYHHDTLSSGNIATFTGTPELLAPELQRSYPQFEEAIRANWVSAFILSAGDKHLQQEGYMADPGFLRVFSFPLLKGNQATALEKKHSIVITENLAQKFFGDGEAMGKVIKIDTNAYFTVTGVIKKPPPNSRFHFDYLVPWNYKKEVGWANEKWSEDHTTTYVLLKPGVTEQAANRSIKNIISQHNATANTEAFLHPARKWILYSNFENGKITGGGIDFVKLLSIIAGFILLIACINYMNLSTARSERRAREVGIRKVSGAIKSSLIWQFLMESIIIAIIAGIISLVIAQLSLGWFNKLIREGPTDIITIPYNDITFWLYGAGFILVTGILAGSYPAFYLSAFRPVKVLKGTFKAAYALITPRKLLVVLQFTCAIVFTISTIVIYRQIKHGMKRDTGMDMNNLVFAYVKGDVMDRYTGIYDELMKSGAVTSVTRTNSPVIDIWSVDRKITWAGKDPELTSPFIRYNSDRHFTQTTGIQLLKGRDINIDRYPTDTMAMLLTESAVKTMRFDNPVGQLVTNEAGTWHVVGVIRDFIPSSPYMPLLPIVVLGPSPRNQFGTFNFKLNPQHEASENIAAISRIFTKYNPDYPFEFYFVEDGYTNKFRFVKHTGTLSAIFAGLTIFISCLGLFALAAFMAESRTKEIGIRKVMGASIESITTLISKDFLKPVLVAFVIASPIAWWMMSHWLQDYSYRTTISWWIFAVTGIIAIVIALCSVGYQAIKAALASPVKSLRSE